VTGLSVLLIDIAAAGVELAMHPGHPDRLRHQPAALAPDLAARLLANKPSILRLLMDGYSPSGTETAYIFAERLGIAEDSRIPVHPGSAAWLGAVGQAMNTTCINTSTAVECAA